MNLETYKEIIEEGLLKEGLYVNIICEHLTNLISRTGIIKKLGKNFILLGENTNFIQDTKKTAGPVQFYQSIIFIEKILEIIIIDYYETKLEIPQIES